MKERRHAPRHEASTTVRAIAVKDKRSSERRLVNASADGVRIALPFEVEPLQKIDLVFSDYEPPHRGGAGTGLSARVSI